MKSAGENNKIYMISITAKLPLRYGFMLVSKYGFLTHVDASFIFRLTRRSKNVIAAQISARSMGFNVNVQK